MREMPRRPWVEGSAAEKASAPEPNPEPAPTPSRPKTRKSPQRSVKGKDTSSVHGPVETPVRSQRAKPLSTTPTVDDNVDTVTQNTPTHRRSTKQRPSASKSRTKPKANVTTSSNGLQTKLQFPINPTIDMDIAETGVDAVAQTTPTPRRSPSQRPSASKSQSKSKTSAALSGKVVQTKLQFPMKLVSDMDTVDDGVAEAVAVDVAQKTPTPRRTVTKRPSASKSRTKSKTNETPLANDAQADAQPSISLISDMDTADDGANAVAQKTPTARRTATKQRPSASKPRSKAKANETPLRSDVQADVQPSNNPINDMGTADDGVDAVAQETPTARRSTKQRPSASKPRSKAKANEDPLESEAQDDVQPSKKPISGMDTADVASQDNVIMLDHEDDKDDDDDQISETGDIDDDSDEEVYKDDGDDDDEEEFDDDDDDDKDENDDDDSDSPTSYVPSGSAHYQDQSSSTRLTGLRPKRSTQSCTVTQTEPTLADRMHEQLGVLVTKVMQRLLDKKMNPASDTSPITTPIESTTTDKPPTPTPTSNPTDKQPDRKLTVRETLEGDKPRLWCPSPGCVKSFGSMTAIRYHIRTFRHVLDDILYLAMEGGSMDVDGDANAGAGAVADVGAGATTADTGAGANVGAGADTPTTDIESSADAIVADDDAGVAVATTTADVPVEATTTTETPKPNPDTELNKIVSEIHQLLLKLDDPIPILVAEFDFSVKAFNTILSAPILIQAMSYKVPEPEQDAGGGGGASGSAVTGSEIAAKRTPKIREPKPPKEPKPIKLIEGHDDTDAPIDPTEPFPIRLRKLIGTLLNTTISMQATSRGCVNRVNMIRIPNRGTKSVACPVPGCSHVFTTRPGLRYHLMNFAHSVSFFLNVIGERVASRVEKGGEKDGEKDGDGEDAGDHVDEATAGVSDNANVDGEDAGDHVDEAAAGVSDNVNVDGDAAVEIPSPLELIQNIRTLIESAESPDPVVRITRFEFEYTKPTSTTKLPMFLTLGSDSSIKHLLPHGSDDDDEARWLQRKSRKWDAVNSSDSHRSNLISRLGLSTSLRMFDVSVMTSNVPSPRILRSAPPTPSDLPDEAVGMAMPSHADWTVLSPEDASMYLPAPQDLNIRILSSKKDSVTDMVVAPFTSAASSTKPKKLTMYLNVGVPVLGMKWCPSVPKSHGCEYLAVAGVQKKISMHILQGRRYTAQDDDDPAMCGSIQIWRVPSSRDSPAVLDLVIAHRHGHVVHLDWCKPIMFDESGDYGRIGFLAVCFGDGSAAVYNVPIPSRVNVGGDVGGGSDDNDDDHGGNRSPVVIYIHKPVLEVCLPDALFTRCAWGSPSSLAFGFQDGRVMLIDPMQSMRTGDFDIHRDLILGFQCHGMMVYDMVWCQSDSTHKPRYLATSSLDGKVTLRDVNDPYHPRIINQGLVSQSSLSYSMHYRTFLLVNTNHIAVSIQSRAFHDPSDRLSRFNAYRWLGSERGGTMCIGMSPRIPFVVVGNADGTLLLSNALRVHKRDHTQMYWLRPGDSEGHLVFDETGKTMQSEYGKHVASRFDRLSAVSVSASVQVIDWAWERAGLVASGGSSGWVRIDDIFSE